ncbi:hypothetical protein ABEV00_27510 [Paenibacillus thiaminolyticus]|uniref:hypothetical protein n=1 Tax=Paenibacillus thiaminolyticus TaxID=49283 RepID=UPI003D2C3560
MHKLVIKERSVYLDGLELKGVVGYELKSSALDSCSKLTIELLVEDSKMNAQEVISPIESLQNLTRGAVLQEKDMDEQRIREIVREELAALQSGQPEEISIKIDKAELGKAVIKALKSLQKESHKPSLTV